MVSQPSRGPRILRRTRLVVLAVLAVELSAPARTPLVVTAVGFTHNGEPPDAAPEHH